MKKLLNKKDKCFFCLNTKTEQHHISYKPEHIVNVCVSCHDKLHIIFKEYHKKIREKDDKLKLISKIIEKKVDFKKIKEDINPPIPNVIEKMNISEIINSNIPRNEKVTKILQLKNYTDRASARRLLRMMEEKIGITNNTQ